MSAIDIRCGLSGCSIVAPGCVGEVGDWDSAASAFVAATVLSLTNASVAAGDNPLAPASALADCAAANSLLVGGLDGSRPPGPGVTPDFGLAGFDPGFFVTRPFLGTLIFGSGSFPFAYPLVAVKFVFDVPILVLSAVWVLLPSTPIITGTCWSAPSKKKPNTKFPWRSADVDLANAWPPPAVIGYITCAQGSWSDDIDSSSWSWRPMIRTLYLLPHPGTLFLSSNLPETILSLQ